MKLTNYESNKFIEGVRKAWDNEHYVFDDKKDLPHDIIFLCTDTSGHKVTDNLTYYYGYTFNKKCSQDEQGQFRNAIKHFIGNKSVFYSRMAEDFVTEGIFKMDRLKSLNDFEVIISTASGTPGEMSLVNLMTDICYNYMDSNTDVLNMKLYKKMCADVTFDENKALKALQKLNRYRDDKDAALAKVEQMKELFEEQKESGKLFKMKLYTPAPVREGFMDFLKFANETEQRIYEKLRKGIEVLICEDFVTSGSTIREMIRFLNSINPNTQISVFVLIDQLRYI